METNAQNVSNETIAREFYAKIVAAKAKLESAEKGRFETSGEFRFSESSAIVNIKGITNTDKLITIAKFLLQQKNLHAEACKELDIKASEPTWLGVKVEKWLSDVKVRATQVNMIEKKAAIEKMEQKILTIVSKEFLQKLALEELKSGFDSIGEI